MPKAYFLFLLKYVPYGEMKSYIFGLSRKEVQSAKNRNVTKWQKKTQLQAKQMAADFLLKTDSCFFKKQMILVSS